jgi:hypothetical protein
VISLMPAMPHDVPVEANPEAPVEDGAIFELPVEAEGLLFELPAETSAGGEGEQPAEEDPEGPIYLDAIMFLPLQFRAFQPPAAEETAALDLSQNNGVAQNGAALNGTAPKTEEQSQPKRLKLVDLVEGTGAQQPEQTPELPELEVVAQPKPVAQVAAPASPIAAPQPLPEVAQLERMERIQELADMPRLDLRTIAEPERVRMLDPTRAEIEVGEGEERVSVKLTTHEKTVTIEASMGNPELAVRLVDASHELRDSLRRHGMELTSFVTNSEQKNGQKDPKNRKNQQREEHEAEPKKNAESLRGVFLLA